MQNPEYNLTSKQTIARRITIDRNVPTPPDDFTEFAITGDDPRESHSPLAIASNYYDLRNSLELALNHSISTPLLLASAIVADEKTKFALFMEMLDKSNLSPETDDQMFAYQFDISSGVVMGTHRINVAERELHGGIPETSSRTQFDELGIETQFTALAIYYEYVKESADLHKTDKSPIRGSLLFTDLLDRLRSGHFVPGIIPHSFPQLVLLGVEDARKSYETYYPIADAVVNS